MASDNQFERYFRELKGLASLFAAQAQGADEPWSAAVKKAAASATVSASTPVDKTCRKCGSTTVTTRYVPRHRVSGSVRRLNGQTIYLDHEDKELTALLYDEHLINTCQTCTYEWPEATRDKTSGGGRGR